MLRPRRPGRPAAVRDRRVDPESPPAAICAKSSTGFRRRSASRGKLKRKVRAISTEGPHVGLHPDGRAVPAMARHHGADAALLHQRLADEPMTWYLLGGCGRLADARQRDDVQDGQFQVLTWKTMIAFLAIASADLAGSGRDPAAWPAAHSQSRGRCSRHAATRAKSSAGSRSRRPWRWPRRGGQKNECRRGSREGGQDGAGLLRQERSGECRTAAHEADPGRLHGPARGRHVLPRPLRLLLHWRQSDAFAFQRVDGQRRRTRPSAAGPSSSWRRRCGYFLPGLVPCSR